MTAMNNQITAPRTLYLDCSSGVSGDMLLASMAHALEELNGPGWGFQFLSAELARLGLEGFELEWVQKKVGGIATWHVDVVETKDQPLRTYSNLVDIIESANLDDSVAERSIAAVTLLGEAEAKVHGVELETVHFHEVGAVDTIVDIVGSMVLMDALRAEKIAFSAVDLGSGFVECAHGKMPVPAPACAELSKGITTFGSECGMERATPTGLSILRTVGHTCGSQPVGKLLSVGYGSGGRSSDAQPTYVRAFVLENVAENNQQAHNHHHHHHHHHA